MKNKIFLIVSLVLVSLSLIIFIWLFINILKCIKSKEPEKKLFYINSIVISTIVLKILSLCSKYLVK